jgi:hypothetical protein
MTFGEMPAITFMHPAVGDPSLARMWALPATLYPLVSFATPPPVAAEPHITGRGWWAVFLEPGWRRSRLHHCAHVVSMRGYSGDDASAKQGR